MVTSTVARTQVMPVVGLTKFLDQLFRSPDIAESINRARASTMLKRMADHLLMGTLTSREVTQAIASVPGRTLKQLAHGDAILSLIHGVAFLYERNPVEAVAVMRPAERDALTKTVARFLKLTALESQGNVPEADGLLMEILLEDRSTKWAKRIYQTLGSVNAEKGMIAAAHNDAATLEFAAERFIVLEKGAKEFGLPGSVWSVIEINRDALSSNFESVQKAMDVPAELAAKNKRAIEAGKESLSQLTEGKATDCLEEFAETVRLLAIDDPLDRWNELAQLIGREWPEGLSPEEAVRQIRE